MKRSSIPVPVPQVSHHWNALDLMVEGGFDAMAVVANINAEAGHEDMPTITGAVALSLQEVNDTVLVGDSECPGWVLRSYADVDEFYGMVGMGPLAGKYEGAGMDDDVFGATWKKLQCRKPFYGRQVRSFEGDAWHS